MGTNGILGWIFFTPLSIFQRLQSGNGLLTSSAFPGFLPVRLPQSGPPRGRVLHAPSSFGPTPLSCFGLIRVDPERCAHEWNASSFYSGSGFAFFNPGAPLVLHPLRLRTGSIRTCSARRFGRVLNTCRGSPSVSMTHCERVFFPFGPRPSTRNTSNRQSTFVNPDFTTLPASHEL